VVTNGRIRQSLAYWCLNATDWQWNIDRICETAVRLGCPSVELAPPELWPVVARYGLQTSLVLNGMADPVFAKGLNNPRHHEEIFTRTKDIIDRCAEFAIPNVIAFTGYKWLDPFDPASGEISQEEGARNTVVRHGLFAKPDQQLGDALLERYPWREAEQDTIAATIHKLETLIPVVQQRVDIRKTLMEKEIGSKLTYYEILQSLIEEQEELHVQKSHLHEAEAAVAAIRETRSQALAEYSRSLSDDLAKSEQKASGLAQDLIKAQQRTKLQQLTSPVDGVVQQLAVHTVGGVVTPAQALLVIVPRESKLEIEAMISNHDIGFVEPGQGAEIKVDTFNFTRYGLLHGEVVSVSQDAIIRDKPKDGGNARTLGTEQGSSEPAGQELNYSARISLDRTQMQVDGRLVNLSSGMAVTVEVKTGQRTILSYLLSPLQRYQQDVLHER